MSPVGYSPTGEAFNLRNADVAKAVAIGLRADKLVFVLESDPGQEVVMDAKTIFEDVKPIEPALPAWLQ